MTEYNPGNIKYAERKPREILEKVVKERGKKGLKVNLNCKKTITGTVQDVEYKYEMLK